MTGAIRTSEQDALEAIVAGRADDPFAVLGVKRDLEMPRAQPATPPQIEQLERAGVNIPAGLTRNAARKLLGTVWMRRKKGLASYRQMRKLSEFGVNAQQMYFATASRVMDAIVKNGYHALPADQLAAIINSRTAGEDG